MIGIVTMPSSVHFACILINPIIDNSEIKGYYRHDGLLDNGYIKKLPNLELKDILLDNNCLLFAYRKIY